MTDAPVATVLVPGPAVSGPILRLTEPLSFWGGVDPVTGRITDIRHPEHGQCVAGTILLVPETRGSSSSSSIMLELIRAGAAPAALVLDRVDAILVLGILVAREMGLSHPPAYRLPRAAMAELAGIAALDRQGRITCLDALPEQPT